MRWLSEEGRRDARAEETTRHEILDRRFSSHRFPSTISNGCATGHSSSPTMLSVHFRPLATIMGLADLRWLLHAHRREDVLVVGYRGEAEASGAATEIQA